jgi:hypothetical protein
MNLAGVVLLGLATWRISSLLVNEDGPFYMFHRLRQWMGVYEAGEMRQTALLFSCVWCMSVWVALVVVKGPRVLRDVMASSAGAILVQEILDRSDPGSS